MKNETRFRMVEQHEPGALPDAAGAGAAGDRERYAVYEQLAKLTLKVADGKTTGTAE